MYEKIGYKVVYTSTKTGLGIDLLCDLLRNNVSVFCGASGVGKSSIINVISPHANMEVGDISEKGKRGKHTTTFSNLIQINNGFVVDSPGFSSLKFNFNKSLLCGYFKEFLPYINSCHFNDCTHIKEINCNLKQNVGATISPQRYERYIKFYNELT